MYTQAGVVSVPHQSGYVYLVTHPHGQYRMIILSRPTITGEMYGIITSLQATGGAQLIPVSSPIVFVPPARLEGPVAYGTIDGQHRLYGTLRGYISRTVDEPFAVLLK